MTRRTSRGHLTWEPQASWQIFPPGSKTSWTEMECPNFSDVRKRPTLHPPVLGVILPPPFAVVCSVRTLCSHPVYSGMDLVPFLQFRSCCAKPRLSSAVPSACVYFFKLFKNLKYVRLHYSVTEDNILYKIISALFKFSLLYWHPINHFGVSQAFLAGYYYYCYSCVSSKIRMHILSWM